MKLISAYELHRRSANELSALFRQVSIGLVTTQARQPGAQERSGISGKYRAGAARADGGSGALSPGLSMLVGSLGGSGRRSARDNHGAAGDVRGQG